MTLLTVTAGHVSSPRGIPLPRPDNVLQRRPNVFFAKFGVFQGIAGGLRKLHHGHLRCHLEHLCRDREPPLPSHRRPLEADLEVLHLRHCKTQPPGCRGDLGHNRHRGTLGGEHRGRLPLGLEQAREIKARRHGGDELEGVEELGNLGITIRFLRNRVLVVDLTCVGDGGQREAFAEPGDARDGGNGGSLGRVGDENLGDQPLGFGRKPGWEIEFRSQDFVIHGHQILVLEGEKASQKNVQNDAAGPGIGFWPIVTLFSQDFRRHVGRGSTLCVEESVVTKLFGQCGQTEIRDFEVFVVVEEEIFGFEIAVGDPSAVAVIDGADQLLEIFAGLIFFELAFGDFGEEFAATDVFHDEVYFCLCGHHLFEFDNVWMSNQTHNRDFAFDLFHHPFLPHLLFTHYFDRHALACAYLLPIIHFGKRPLPQKPPQLVLSEHRLTLFHHPLTHSLMTMMMIMITPKPNPPTHFFFLFQVLCGGFWNPILFRRERGVDLIFEKAFVKKMFGGEKHL